MSGTEKKDPHAASMTGAPEVVPRYIRKYMQKMWHLK